MRRTFFPLLSRPETWFWALLLWFSLSAARSWQTPWATAALTEWLRWAGGIGLMLAMGRWLIRPRLAARLVVVCTGIIAAIGLVDGIVMAHGGFVGPFRDHQLCGTALLILLPLTLAVGLTARELHWKWIAQIVAMAALVCLVMTETRSAWIGAAFSGATFFAAWWRRGRVAAGRRQAKQILVPVLLAFGVGSFFLIMIGMTEMQQGLAVRAGSLSALERDGSWQQRLRAWHGAERMVAAQPLTGWGLGRYPGAQWRFTHVGRILAPSQRPSLSEQAHDLPLQTSAETGVIGMGLLVAALIAFWARCRAVLRQGKGQPLRSRDGFLIATLALIAGLAVDSLASPSYQFPEVSLLVWASLGIGLAALNRQESSEETLPLHAPAGRFARLVVAGAMAVALAGQVLPLGLLSPVEAYTIPSDYSQYQTCTVTADRATAQPGDVVTLTMTATYKDGAGNPVTVDVTHDRTTQFFRTDSNQPFTFTNNTFVMPDEPSITVRGTFRDERYAADGTKTQNLNVNSQSNAVVTRG